MLFKNLEFCEARVKRTLQFSGCAKAQIAAYILLFVLCVVDRAGMRPAAQHSSFAGRQIQVVNRASESACTLHSVRSTRVTRSEYFGGALGALGIHS